MLWFLNVFSLIPKTGWKAFKKENFDKTRKIYMSVYWNLWKVRFLILILWRVWFFDIEFCEESDFFQIEFCEESVFFILNFVKCPKADSVFPLGSFPPAITNKIKSICDRTIKLKHILWYFDVTMLKFPILKIMLFLYHACFLNAYKHTHAE